MQPMQNPGETTPLSPHHCKANHDHNTHSSSWHSLNSKDAGEISTWNFLITSAMPLDNDANREQYQIFPPLPTSLDKSKPCSSPKPYHTTLIMTPSRTSQQSPPKTNGCHCSMYHSIRESSILTASQHLLSCLCNTTIQIWQLWMPCASHLIALPPSIPVEFYNNPWASLILQSRTPRPSVTWWQCPKSSLRSQPLWYMHSITLSSTRNYIDLPLSLCQTFVWLLKKSPLLPWPSYLSQNE